ncbi:MAG TPA: NAD(P)/FAD-dependent oxidoreductase, partial [Anaerolineales bacterium]
TERKRYGSKILVVATGTRPLHLKGLVIPDELAGRVYYEVYELLHLEGKRVAIVGSGDAAFDYALNLGKKNRVLILNRGPQPKCLPLLWERSQKSSAITYHDNLLICQISVNSEGGLCLDCQSEAGEIRFQVDYLLGAIGREAQMDCLSEAIKKQERRLVSEGVLYLIGDVKNGIFRQTSIAVGEGVMAAMKIYRRLREGIA